MRRQKLIAILLSFVVFGAFQTQAKEGTYASDRYVTWTPTGNDQDIEDLVTTGTSLQHPWFNNYDPDMVIESLIGEIELGIDWTRDYYPADTFDVEYVVDYDYWEYEASPSATSGTVTLRVQYRRGDETATVRSSDHFFLARAAKIEITDVDTNYYEAGTTTDLTYRPENVYFQLKIHYEHYQELENIQAPSLTLDCNDEDKVDVTWSAHTGAEDYELEWTFVSEESTLPSPTFNFKHNATKVITTETSYRVPKIYPAGYLVFRIRKVGRDPHDIETKTYGVWSIINTTDVISNITSGQDYCYISVGHEEKKNWQYSNIFAEEGKYKEAITYFDGTQRQRQAQTRLNSSIVDEMSTPREVIVTGTVYDAEGRGAITGLPVPDFQENYLGYRNKFYRPTSDNTREYRFYDFDVISGSCVGSATAMDDVSGAERYYSNENDLLGTDRFADFLPEASGYPFVRSTYTLDNTGRLRHQSAPGVDHKVGSGHETKYMYGTPLQSQLDRILGSEAGKAIHYLKEVTIDPNGVISVTYKDPTGEVVATSLAGDGSTNPGLINLDGASQSQTINEDLLTNDRNQVEGTSIVMSMTHLVTTDATHTFDYSFDIPSYSDDCIPDENICFDCVYDLEIHLYDECGVDYWPSAIRTVTVQADTLETDCDTPLSFSLVDEIVETSIDINLTVGEYRLVKELKLNIDARNYFLEQFFNLDTCLLTYDDFRAEFIAGLDTLVCSMDCDVLDSLITYNPYNLDQEQLDELEARRDFMCSEYDRCEAYYNMMLQDMSPGGQYAHYEIGPLTLDNDGNQLQQPVYDPTTGGLVIDTDDPYSIFYDGTGDNYVIAYDDIANIDYPNGDMVEIDGQMVSISTLSPEEFVENWQEEWAEALVVHHPEYGCYATCTTLTASYDYDMDMLGTDNWAAAEAAGYLNPLDNYGNPSSNMVSGLSLNSPATADPFFTTYTSYQTEMEGYLDAYPFHGITTPGIPIPSMWQLMMIAQMDQSGIDISQSAAYLNNVVACQSNYSWTVFRSMYLAAKQEIYTDFYNGCSSFLNGGATFGESGNDKSRRFIISTSDAIEEMGLNEDQDPPLDPNDDGNITIEELEDFANGAMDIDSYISRCTNYAIIWEQQLEGCIDPNDMDDILQELINICACGSGPDNPFGASNCPQYQGQHNSFEDVIAAYLDENGIDYTGTCNPWVINSPRPQGHSYFDTDAVDECACDSIIALHEEFQDLQGQGSLPAGICTEQQYFNEILGAYIDPSLIADCYANNGESSEIDCRKFIQYYHQYIQDENGGVYIDWQNISMNDMSLWFLQEHSILLSANEVWDKFKNCFAQWEPTPLPINCKKLWVLLRQYYHGMPIIHTLDLSMLADLPGWSGFVSQANTEFNVNYSTNDYIRLLRKCRKKMRPIITGVKPYDGGKDTLRPGITNGISSVIFTAFSDTLPYIPPTDTNLGTPTLPTPSGDTCKVSSINIIEYSYTEENITEYEPNHGYSVSYTKPKGTTPVGEPVVVNYHISDMAESDTIFGMTMGVYNLSGGMLFGQGTITMDTVHKGNPIYCVPLIVPTGHDAVGKNVPLEFDLKEIIGTDTVTRHVSVPVFEQGTLVKPSVEILVQFEECNESCTISLSTGDSGDILNWNNIDSIVSIIPVVDAEIPGESYEFEMNVFMQGESWPRVIEGFSCYPVAYYEAEMDYDADTLRRAANWYDMYSIENDSSSLKMGLVMEAAMRIEEDRGWDFFSNTFMTDEYANVINGFMGTGYTVNQIQEMLSNTAATYLQTAFVTDTTALDTIEAFLDELASTGQLASPYKVYLDSLDASTNYFIVNPLTGACPTYIEKTTFSKGVNFEDTLVYNFNFDLSTDTFDVAFATSKYHSGGAIPLMTVTTADNQIYDLDLGIVSIEGASMQKDNVIHLDSLNPMLLIDVSSLIFIPDSTDTVNITAFIEFDSLHYFEFDIEVLYKSPLKYGNDAEFNMVFECFDQNFRKMHLSKYNDTIPWDSLVGFTNIRTMREDTLFPKDFELKYLTSNNFVADAYTSSDDTVTVSGSIDYLPVSYAFTYNEPPQEQIPEEIACDDCMDCEDFIEYLGAFTDYLAQYDQVGTVLDDEGMTATMLTEYINSHYNYNFGYDEIIHMMENCFPNAQVSSLVSEPSIDLMSEVASGATQFPDTLSSSNIRQGAVNLGYNFDPDSCNLEVITSVGRVHSNHLIRFEFVHECDGGLPTYYAFVDTTDFSFATIDSIRMGNAFLPFRNMQIDSMITSPEIVVYSNGDSSGGNLSWARTFQDIPDTSGWDDITFDTLIALCNHPQLENPYDEEDDCMEDLIELAESNAQIEYSAYVDSMEQVFINNYTDACMAADSTEEFTMEYSDREHHFTLYYRDQAGNLIKTVPPGGVQLIDLSVSGDSIDMYRSDPSTYSSHRVKTHHEYPTMYKMNTLNQALEENTPDAGRKRMWYDRLGRVVASQSAQERMPNDTSYVRYMYTLYDELGRLYETGRVSVHEDDTLTTPVAFIYTDFVDWLDNDGDKSEVIRTFYDEARYLMPGFLQRNLRNRVASITYSERDFEDRYDHAFHYSYDIHGNVKKMINEIPAFDAFGEEIRYMRLDYEYDLVSSNVHKVWYQRGRPDQIAHRYTYDADNRIVDVESSTDGLVWHNDARYDYYLHGPMGRTELGDIGVQGTDYAYTIQGWTKGANAGTSDETRDMGEDANASIASARDAFGYVLNYYNGDYTGIGGTTFEPTLTGDFEDEALDDGLFNGNITRMTTALLDNNQDHIPVMGNVYKYDQLNRIREKVSFEDAGDDVHDNNSWNAVTSNGKFNETFTYDGNGNIMTLDRVGDGTDMDEFDYKYIPGTNQLDHVDDVINATNFEIDIDDQDTLNYLYDLDGNLVKDIAEGIDTIEWTAYGKVEDVEYTGGSGEDIHFEYDALGNRIIKLIQGETVPRMYVYSRDHSGNVMANYKVTVEGALLVLSLEERMLYGSKRLGLIAEDTTEIATTTSFPQTYASDTASDIEFPLYHPDSVINDTIDMPFDTVGYDTLIGKIYGARKFELSNHLGNVLSVISDRKLPVDEGSDNDVDYYEPDIDEYYDYYAFGSLMPEKYTTGVLDSVDNIVHEQDFVDDINGWYEIGSPVTLTHGTNRLEITTEDLWDGAGIDFATENGETYTISIDVTHIDDYAIALVVKNASGGTITSSYIYNSNSMPFTLQFTATSTTSKIYITKPVYDGVESTVAINYLSVTAETPILVEGSGYRYGFNGKEKDDEVYGTGNQYDYGFRIYNPRIGKFLSVDPLTKEYPWYTPYQFAGNMPIWAIDRDGLEEEIVITLLSSSTGTIQKTKVDWRDIEGTVGEHGPKGTGTLYVKVVEDAGKYQYTAVYEKSLGDYLFRTLPQVLTFGSGKDQSEQLGEEADENRPIYTFDYESLEEIMDVVIGAQKDAKKRFGKEKKINPKGKEAKKEADEISKRMEKVDKQASQNYEPTDTMRYRQHAKNKVNVNGKDVDPPKGKTRIDYPCCAEDRKKND